MAAAAGAAFRLQSLKQYLILFDNPELMDPSSHQMATSLFTAMVKLSEKAKDALRNWITREVGSERFARWLGAIQQYISIRYVGEVGWRFLSASHVLCAGNNDDEEEDDLSLHVYLPTGYMNNPMVMCVLVFVSWLSYIKQIKRVEALPLW